MTSRTPTTRPAIQQLPIPAGFFSATTTAVNDSGDVVGYAGSPNIDSHAVLWRNGMAIDLGVWPGGHYSVANGINNLGQIVGTGTVAGDNLDHALMWTVDEGTPTPTPTPTPTVQVTVQSNPAGRTFSVDGTTYRSTRTFTWASGSSHTIGTTSPQNGAPSVRYVWNRWSDGGAISHTVAPTTNKTYTANFRTQYQLTMSHGTMAPCVPRVGGETAEQLFRSGPCRLTVTVSPIGVVAEQAPILGRTIRLELQWADRSRRGRPSRIIDCLKAKTRQSSLGGLFLKSELFALRRESMQ